MVRFLIVKQKFAARVKFIIPQTMHAVSVECTILRLIIAAAIRLIRIRRSTMIGPVAGMNIAQMVGNAVEPNVMTLININAGNYHFNISTNR